jgi:hypothetical protein
MDTGGLVHLSSTDDTMERTRRDDSNLSVADVTRLYAGEGDVTCRGSRRPPEELAGAFPEEDGLS